MKTRLPTNDPPSSSSVIASDRAALVFGASPRSISVAHKEVLGVFGVNDAEVCCSSDIAEKILEGVPVTNTRVGHYSGELGDSVGDVEACAHHEIHQTPKELSIRELAGFLLFLISGWAVRFKDSEVR